MNNNIALELVAEDGTRVNLNSPADSIYLKPDIEGLTTLPTIRSSNGTNVGMDGGWTSAQFFDARLISVKGVIADQDVAVVEQKRRELNALLAKKKLQLNLTTEAGNSYSVSVRVMEVTMVMSTLLIAQEFKIDFRADDPLIYDNASGGDLIATLQVARLLGGFEINFNIPFEISGSGSDSIVTNTGTSEVYPLITVKGPLHSPSIINSTTNQQLNISRDLNAGDTIEIDSKFKTITLNGLDIYSDVTGDFITLASGENKMRLTTQTSSDNGYAEIRFKSGYYSI